MSDGTKKLLSCPFCGARAVMVRAFSWMVVCPNEKCLIGPTTQRYAREEEKEAILAWNTRVEGPKVSKRFVEKWADKMSFIKQQAREQKFFPMDHGRLWIREILREAGVEVEDI